MKVGERFGHTETRHLVGDFRIFFQKALVEHAGVPAGLVGPLILGNVHETGLLPLWELRVGVVDEEDFVERDPAMDRIGQDLAWGGV